MAKAGPGGVAAFEVVEPAVLRTLVRVAGRFGKTLHTHPNFEAMGLQETVMGLSEESTTPQQEDAFFDNLLKLHAQLRISFPNTVTIQLTNYPLKKLGLLTSRFKAMGTGLGGPDVFVNDRGSNRPDGVYSYYPKLAGIVPLAPMVAAGNYIAARHSGSADEAPRVNQHYDFARNRLKANYIFWARPAGRSRYFPQVLDILNQPELCADPADGLSKTCPSVLASCVN